jgi:peroxiredoxin
MFGASYNYPAFQRGVLLKDLAVSRFGGAPSAGDQAPDFEGRTLEGKKVRLKDYRGKRNLVLTFGSATCPQTASSLPDLNDLYEQRDEDEVEYLLVYTREAHPGERIPAHESKEDKERAAERLQEADGVEIPILVDDVNGKIHRKYGTMPNATFIIDKSGRVAFRSLFTRSSLIAEALEELLEVQRERGIDHAVVGEGEDLSLPSPYVLLRGRRALERGGRRSVANFRREMGLPGRFALASSRMVQPVLENPGKTVLSVAAVGVVLGAGIWGGLLLRRKRLSTYHSPYESRVFQRFQRNRYGDMGEYEAVGI